MEKEHRDKKSRMPYNTNEKLTAEEAEFIASRFMEIFNMLPPDRQVAIYYRLEQEQKEK